MRQKYDPRKFYEHWHEEFSITTPIEVQKQRMRLNAIRELLPPNPRNILYVGCGKVTVLHAWGISWQCSA